MSRDTYDALQHLYMYLDYDATSCCNLINWSNGGVLNRLAIPPLISLIPPLIQLIPPLVASGALRQTFDNVTATSLERN